MTKLKTLWIGVSVINLLCVSAYAAPFFQGLGDLPGGDFKSRANGVSADGRVVVGNSRSANGREAFRWTRQGGIVGLGIAEGSSSSSAIAVSTDGSVVVGNGGIPFIWTTQNKTLQLMERFSSIIGMSDDGQTIIGKDRFDWTVRSTNRGASVSRTVAPSADVNAISGNGDFLVGRFDSSLEAARWNTSGGSPMRLGKMPLSVTPRSEVITSFSTATGVSADGSTVIGYGTYGNFISFGIPFFVGTTGFRSGPVPIFMKRPLDVSANGSVIVGWSEKTSGSFPRRRASIWNSTNRTYSLLSLLEDDYSLDLTGWTLTEATGISDDGFTIVGNGINPDGLNEAWIAVIPEPGTCSLLIGLLAMGRVLRYRSF